MHKRTMKGKINPQVDTHANDVLMSKHALITFGNYKLPSTASLAI